MSIKLQLPKVTELRPRLTVIGVGGAGGNAVNNMIAAGLAGVEFIVANTDSQALLASSAEHRIQLGVNLTEGLGAGSKPEIGEAAAEEAIEEIRSRVSGAHMVFVAAGMGGGTGTGAAAVIARVAKEEGVLVVGIVTKPFQFEGVRRMRMAEAGIAELKKHVDTLIVIPNQNLFRIANEKTTFAEAFVLADQVLYSGISCIVDLIIKEGLINLDFADVRTILSGMGTAMMGTGEASGERRAILAAEDAISNPLLDEVSLKGAKGLLLSIIGGRNLTLFEVDEAASRVRQEVDPEANIIVGATFDDHLGDRVRVSIVASGMSRAAEGTVRQPAPAAPVHASVVPSTPVMSPAPPSVRQAKPAAHPAAVPPPAPAAPQHDAAHAGATPRYASHEDELTHRLFAAMAAEDGGRYQENDDTWPDTGSTIAGAPWRAPGEVVIEDSLPPLTSAPAPQPRQRAAPAAAVAAPVFVPAAPSEVRRPVQRRMPELEDFPPVGQRDYRAKAGQEPNGSRPPPPREAAAPPPPPRKPGLFERLTGLGRRGGESEAATDSATRITPHEPAAPAARGQAYGQTRQTSAQRPPSAADRAPQRRVSNGSQAHELPVFFSKDQK